MAKASTKNTVKAASGLSDGARALLVTLSQAGDAGMYAPNNADLSALSSGGYADVNASMIATDGSGNVAARITANGTAFLVTPPAPTPAIVNTAAAVATGGFAILKNVTLPGVIRGRSVGAAKYPFDSLEVGDAFFVAATAERPDPADGLGSTVSSATRRYAKADPAAPTKTVTRAKRGPDRKSVLVNGEKVMETTTVPNLIPTRIFEMRAISDGAAYGAPGVKGALIGRTQ